MMEMLVDHADLQVYLDDGWTVVGKGFDGARIQKFVDARSDYERLGDAFRDLHGAVLEALAGSWVFRRFNELIKR